MVAFDWNDLPVGREFDCKFLKKVNPHPMPCLPPRRHYIDRCIKHIHKKRRENFISTSQIMREGDWKYQESRN